MDEAMKNMARDNYERSIAEDNGDDDSEEAEEEDDGEDEVEQDRLAMEEIKRDLLNDEDKKVNLKLAKRCGYKFLIKIDVDAVDDFQKRYDEDPNLLDENEKTLLASARLTDHYIEHVFGEKENITNQETIDLLDFIKYDDHAILNKDAMIEIYQNHGFDPEIEDNRQAEQEAAEAKQRYQEQLKEIMDSAHEEYNEDEWLKDMPEL